MQTFYCDGCDNMVSDASTRVEEKTERLPVGGGPLVDVKLRVRMCNACNGEVCDDALMDEGLQSVYAMSR